MSVHKYMCIYICVYIYTYTCVYTDMYIYTYVQFCISLPAGKTPAEKIHKMIDNNFVFMCVCVCE